MIYGCGCGGQETIIIILQHKNKSMYRAFITDIDGTLTDNRRRLSTKVVDEIRRLIDAGVIVVLASGNTLCFLDALSHMIGTDGNVIAENGGVYRKGFLGVRKVAGNHDLCMEAYKKIISEVQPKGDELRLFSAELRHSDVAFSRDINIETVSDIIRGMGVEAVDTGFAIHLHTPGISKGKAFEMLAKDLGISTSEFVAAGDSINDVSMLELSGAAIVPSNGSSDAKKVASEVLSEPFGDAVAKALVRYF